MLSTAHKPRPIGSSDGPTAPARYASKLVLSCGEEIKTPNGQKPLLILEPLDAHHFCPCPASVLGLARALETRHSWDLLWKDLFRSERLEKDQCERQHRAREDIS